MTYSVHNVTLTVGCSILQYVADMTPSYCIPSRLFFVCCPKASAFVLQMYVSIYYGFISMHTHACMDGADLSVTGSRLMSRFECLSSAIPTEWYGRDLMLIWRTC